MYVTTSMEHTVIRIGVIGCALLISSTAYAACVYPAKNTQLGARDTKKDATVSQLQQFLNMQYPGTIVNGYFGPKTRTAVIRFQRENKIPQTGKVGPQTRARMQTICGAAPRKAGEVPDEKDTGVTCKVLYDGCNICSRDEIGGMLRCTMRACPEAVMKDTVCKSFFGFTATNVPAVDPKEIVCSTEHKPACGTPYHCLIEDNLKETMPRECTHGKTYKNRCMLDAEKALFLHEGTCAQ